MPIRQRVRLFYCVIAVFFASNALVFASDWEWQNPMLQGNHFFSLWGKSNTDMFAVGSLGGIFRYDGSKWTMMNSGTTRELSSVWGSSENNVFAVGNFGTFLRYDGNNWTAISLSGAVTWLESVWGSSATNVFLVGESGNILRYDGNTVTKMNSGVTNWLRSVWGTAGNNVLVVGNGGAILRYDGNTWTGMNSGTAENLNAIWGSSATDVFAAGDKGTILHYDGNAWTSMVSGTTETLRGIRGISGNNVFAVGTNGTILHYDGNTWTKMTSQTTRHLRGILGFSDSDVFVVGEYGEIVHYDGSLWTRLTQGYTNWLRGVVRISDDIAFAVGQAGTILRYDGSLWTKTNSGISANLFGIWGKAWTEVYAVGDSGTIVHYDGNTWIPMNSGIQTALYGVWGTSGSNIFAVGSSGVILHYDGNTWTGMSSGVSVTLYGIWGSSETDVFAVGANGAILHYDGSAWTTMSSGTSNKLNAIWGNSASDVFAVGLVGTILHYDGRVWTKMNTGTMDNELSGVWGTSGTNVFASGSFGALLRYDGSTWKFMSSGASVWLYSVWGTSQTDVFAVGGGGAILHYSAIIVAPRSFQISEPDGFAKFDIRLIAEPAADVRVRLFASNPSECTVSPESVTLNSGNWQNGIEATVTAEYDGIRDGAQLCRIFTAKAESSDPKYDGVNPADVTVTVLDDSPGVPIFSAYPTYGTANQSMTVTIKGQGFDANTKAYIRPVAGGAEIEMTPLTVKDANTLSAIIPASPADNYTIRVAGLSDSQEFVNAVSFAGASLIASQAQKKAIIVAGGPYLDNVLWKSVRKCANRAYFALYTQGYADDSIYYLSVEPYDVNGDGINDVDGYSGLSALQYAITNWAKTGTDEVLLYMVGIGESGYFTLNDTEKLEASVLAGWLNDLQSAIPGRVIVVYDAAMSGSFMSVLQAPPGKERVVITGTDPTQMAYFLNDGELSFSYPFWSSISDSGELYRSYAVSKAVMVFPQTPMLDANGDGIADTTARSLRDNTEIMIGRGRNIETNSPVIGDVSPPQTLYKGRKNAELWAGEITAENGISRVEAKIYPPHEYFPEELLGSVTIFLKLLGPDAESKFRNTYDAFDQLGEYPIYVYATDMKDYNSMSARTAVSKSDSIPPFCISQETSSSGSIGDINNDGKTDLKDEILILKILSGINVTKDIVHCGIGIETAVYVLQQISGLR